MYACRYVCTYVQCPYVLYMRMYESGRKWGKTQRSTCQPPPPLPPRNPPWRETSIAPDPEIRNRDRKPLLSFFPMSVRRLGGGGGGMYLQTNPTGNIAIIIIISRPVESM